MFSITSQKDIISIERRLNLKKSGILPAGSLLCKARLDLGVEVKSADNGNLLGNFDRIFNGKISGKAQQQDERITKARQQLEKWVHQGESENKIKNYADTQQEDIIRDWNQFMRADLKRTALDALEEALKKAKIDYSGLKIRFSSVDLKDNQMEFLTGVLAIAGRGAGHVAASGMTTLVSGLQNLVKPMLAIESGWEKNTKLLKQGTQDAMAIQKNIMAMRKVSSGISARLSRMDKIEGANNKLSAQGIKGAGAVQAAVSKYQKIAKLNDQDKVLITLNKAHTAITATLKEADATVVKTDTIRLEAIFSNVSKLLAEAEKIAKSDTDAYARAIQANAKAIKSMKQSGASMEDALKEMKLKAKMGG